MKKIVVLLIGVLVIIGLTCFSQTTPTLKQVANAGNTAFKPLYYNANYGAQATARWLTDKRYVDSSNAVISAAGWQITGNVLGADTRFLGSTDNFDVLFKTNNIERGRFLKTGELRLGLASTVNASLILNNSTNANTLTINSGVTSASYALTLPTDQGGASTVLQNNGAGVLSWASPSATAWMLAGNALTGAEHTPTEFFGSTNNFDVVFRENNVEVFRLYDGFMGIGQILPTAKINAKGVGTTSATLTALFENSGGVDLLALRDDGNIIAGDPVDNNLSIGINNGFGGTTADESVYIGFNCGTSITDGVRNVLIGKNVFAGLTTGDNNIGIGSSGVGSGLTTGNYNIRIGQQAGGNSGETVSIGYQAGNASSGLGGTYIGHGAAQLTTSGTYNTMIGEAAGASNTTGGSNTYIGGETGLLNVGSSNVFLGYSAGWRQTATSNKFILCNALRANASLELTTSLMVGNFGTDSSNQDMKFNGELLLTSGINTTAGDAATIQAQTGRFRKDATGTTFTLTNANITANSIIIITYASDPGITGFDSYVVAGAGSAVITFTTSGVPDAPSNSTDINFVIYNNL